jgi:hypothetical protein
VVAMTRVLTRLSLRETLTTAWTSFERTPAAQSKPAPQFQRLQMPVLLFGCFVALLVLLAAYFTDRNGHMDELTFYNPSYMISHFGKWTYPGYAHRTYFADPVITHPPLHVGLIGLLGRIGFTYYYAEATPTVFFFLLGILLILHGPFPAPVKLGLLFSIAFLMLTGETFALFFGTRPEGELHAAWFAALILLESGRLDSWSHPKLFAGAFLLTWASGLHYYAGAAFLGVAVYMIWAPLSLGKAGWSRTLALCAGGCLFGIPYAAFYLIPYSKKIWAAIQANQGNLGVLVAVRTHLESYRKWAQFDYVPALIKKPFGLGIPLLLFSTAILSVIRTTRGLALAALPLQLFIFGIASHKLSGYFIHETAFFVAAVTVGSLVLAEQLWRRVPFPWFQKLFLPAAAVLLFLYLVTGNRTLRAAVVSAEPHVHEADVARAAARKILGPQASVAGRLGAWYSSGAAYWWDIESEMLGPIRYDPVKFFANFDAVVEYPHMSDGSGGGTISAWYAHGDLKLRGFYFGETNEQLQLTLLSAHPVTQVVGYAARNGQVYRFEEQADGDYQVLSAACPTSITPVYRSTPQRWQDTFVTTLHLPTLTPADPPFLVTVLAPRRAPEPAAWMGRSCREVSRHNGSLLLADRKALVASLRSEDRPIQFYANLDQMPGYVGVGLPVEMTPPQDGVRLSQILKFSEIQTPRGVPIGGTPPFTITTGPLLGDFGAAIPLDHGDLVSTPCWVQLRLRVKSGRIAFGTFNARRGIFFHRTGASVLKSSEPLDVALTLEGLRGASHVVIFNDGQLPGQVEVLDGAVFVTQQDWEHNRTALATIR